MGFQKGFDLFCDLHGGNNELKKIYMKKLSTLLRNVSWTILYWGNIELLEYWNTLEFVG